MNKRYLRFINTLFIVAPMSLIMAIVGITINNGFNEEWFSKIFNTWVVMFPVAFVSAFFIIPPAKKLAEKVAIK